MDQGQGAHRPGRREARPVLEYVVSASRRGDGWIKVAVRWPDGVTTTGAASSGERRESRARAATTAMSKALQPILEARGAKIEVDHVLVHRMGKLDSVVVRAQYDAPIKTCAVAGTALIRDDVATAAARAFLHAVNRPLTLVLQAPAA